MDESRNQPVPTGHAAPAGWYPTDGGMLRYWDGRQWTNHVQPPPVPQPVYTPAYPRGPVQIVSDQRTNPVEVAFAWIFAVLTFLYMLPWAIAATRGKSNSLAIALVNFFLGWTFIGWLVALVMACQSHQVAGFRQ